MQGSLRRSIAAAAVMGVALAAAGAAAVGFNQPAPNVQAAPLREVKRSRRAQGHANPSSWHHTYLNHGPSAAQVKRASKKARNVKRHKAHVRG